MLLGARAHDAHVERRHEGATGIEDHAERVGVVEVCAPGRGESFVRDEVQEDLHAVEQAEVERRDAGVAPLQAIALDVPQIRISDLRRDVVELRVRGWPDVREDEV